MTAKKLLLSTQLVCTQQASPVLHDRGDAGDVFFVRTFEREIDIVAYFLLAALFTSNIILRRCGASLLLPSGEGHTPLAGSCKFAIPFGGTPF